MEKATSSKWTIKVDEARHLAMPWARVVEVEMKANLLEVELACTMER